MNTHSKNLTRGRLWRLLLCLTLALIMALGVGITAFAGSSSLGTVTIWMKNGYGPPWWTGDWYGNHTTATTSTINLGVDKIYEASPTNFQRVSKMTLEADITTKSSIRVSIPQNLQNVSQTLTGSKLTVTQTSSSTNNYLTYSDFNSLMNNITFSYSDSTNYTEQSQVKVTIRFWTWRKGGYQQVRDSHYRFTSTLTFLDYADGATAISDENPVKVSYQNETGSEKIVEGAADVNQGIAEIPWKFTDFGDANEVTYGYQLLPSTTPFTDSATVYGQQTLNVSWMSDSQKNQQIEQLRTMRVSGFDSDTQYYARLVFITDGDTSNKTYSEAVPIRYDKPIISGFNMTNINKIYQGGDTTDITMTGSFNNSNYDNVSFCYDVDGNIVSDCTGSSEEHAEHYTVTGPRLKANIYFSSNYQEVVQSDGTILVSDDTEWEPVTGTAPITVDLQNGTEISRTFDASKTHWDAVAVPELDSRLCTFKAELTDVVTGYTVTKFFTASTDSSGSRQPAVFTIDTTAPSEPTVTAKVGTNTYPDPEPSDALTVGGEGGSVALEIEGGNDISNNMLGSGVAEYSYSMYYLSTDKVTAFAGEGATVQGTLEKLGELTETSNDPNIEYTNWTSLQTTVTSDATADPPTETATASFSVSNDGYYRMDVRTTDVAGYNSTKAKEVYFRVDLTPPNTPDVFLAQGTSVDALSAYDNRTYKNETVWMLIDSKAITGKTISTWEYSNDGGLSWNAIEASDEYVYDNPDGKTVEVFAKGSYDAKETFKYTYAVNLSGKGHDDYETFIVRVVDTFGNTSQVSDPVVMRTIAAQPEGSFAVTHEGIEVALAMGNTQIRTSSLTADLKNAASDKINEKFYGTTGGTTMGEADFNPWLWVQTQTHAWNASYNCHWTNDSSASGACHGADCPYATLLEKGYSIYLPAQVNVQGISGANANDTSQFNWVRYDHTNYYFADGEIPDGKNYSESNSYTVYSVTSAAGAAITTDLTGPKTGAHDGKIYYKSNDRIIYTGQKTAGSITEAANSSSASGFILFNPRSTGTGMHAWADLAAGGITYTGDWVDNGAKSAVWINKTNIDSSQGVLKRLYHLVDISYPRVDATGHHYYNAQASTGGDLSRMAMTGYRYGSLRDWLFLYNNQPTKKTIYFTVDDSTMFPHAHDGYAFLFNTTIRQSTVDKSWRLSGYMFLCGSPSSTATLDPFQWYMVKIDDVNMEHFADGTLGEAAYMGLSGGKTGRANPTRPTQEDLTLNLLKGYGTNTSGADYGLTVLATTAPIYQSLGNGFDAGTYNVNNFVLVTEGTETKLYNYRSDTTSAAGTGETLPVSDLVKQFENDVTEANELGAESAGSGYRLVEWSTVTAEGSTGDKYTINTPRPTVDGVQIGSAEAKSQGIHTDTWCYGFGPMGSAKSTGHGCYRDSRIVVSNIYMRMDVAKTLAEVVSEPQWGDGKAKYILNLSDDSSEDFNDPILSAQVQWRLFNDDAKYVGWGADTNESITKDFLTRIEGTGMYEVHVGDATVDTEVDEIATYITTQYYSELGYDATLDTPIVDQIASDLSSDVAQQGVTFDLDDMENFTLRVSDYNSSSANPDFPEGRWWIIHDVNGFPAAEKSARSDAWSDALELTINEAGRWTVYFAPDRGSDGYPINLDPADAVFNFTVNRTPVAQFTGNVNSTTKAITISNDAYDPETYDSDAGAYVNGEGYTLDGDKIQLTGIVGTHWRWELLSSTTSSDGVESLLTLARSNGWIDNANYFNNKNVRTLTNGNVTPEGQAYATKTSNGTYYFESIPEGAILTVYQYVEDVSTYVTGYKTDANGAVYVDKDGSGIKVIDETYYGVSEVRPNTQSGILQQNITEGSDEEGMATYAPQAAFSLDTVNIYNTADSTDVVTVSRESLQTQGKDGFEESWAIDLNDGNGYRILGKVGENWYLYPEADYLENGVFKSEDRQKETLGAINTSTATLVLENKTTPDQAGGRGTGTWVMTKQFIESKAATSGKLILRITESIFASKDIAGNTDVYVTDQSARAVYYKADTNPPTAQSVSGKIYTLNADGETYTESNYAAGSYLDVSNGRAKIQLHVGGSVEREGVLADYKYYFYKTTGSTTNYYVKDSEGRLVTPEAGNTEAAATKGLGAAGGTIEIDYLTMTKIPLDSINVAVYAVDNAGNKTTPTRYENIKLSVSEPAAPAITATDSLGNIVNSIGNSYVFYETGKDASSGTPDYDAAGNPNSSGTGDQMTVNTNLAYTNSTVNISFSPKTGRFGRDTNGDYQLETDANKNNLTGTTEMFADAFNQADLTNTALIIYSVFVRTSDNTADLLDGVADGYTYYYTNEYVEDGQGGGSYQNVYWKDREMSASRTLSLANDGAYKVTARVRNGAGTLSTKAQTIQFTIDKTAPTEIQSITLTDGNDNKYDKNQWAKEVTIRASGADDANSVSARYQYSINNGATWETVMVGLGNTATIPFKETGEYTVMIRAVDQAGNSSPVETHTVKIDQNPPVMSPPTLSASSKEITVYKDYIVTVEHSPAGGEVYTQYETDTGVDYTNVGDEFMCANGGSMVFKIAPDADHMLDSVTLGGVEMTGTEYLEFDGDTSSYILTTPPITSDVTLKVAFLSTNVTYQSVYAMAETTTQTTAAISNTIETLAAELAADNDTTTDGTGDGTTDGTGDGTTDGTGDGTTDGGDGTTDGGDGTTDGGDGTTDGGDGGTTGGDGDGDTGTDVTGGPYSVSITSPIGGNISGTVGDAAFSGSFSGSSVAHGDIVRLQVKLIKGFELESLLINNVAASVDDLSYDAVSDTYTYKDFTVTENLTITFVYKNLSDSVRLIKTSPAVGGSVTIGDDSPAYNGDRQDGNYKVYENKLLYIDVTPNADYQIESIKVAGQEITDVSFPIASSHRYFYTVPEGEESDVISVEASFGVSDDSKRVQIGMTVMEDPTTGSFEGITLDEYGDGVLELPTGSSYTVKIVPKPHYKLAYAARHYTEDLSGEDRQEEVTDLVESQMVTEADGSIYYLYTFNAVTAATKRFEVRFTPETFAVTLSSNNGGVLNLSGYVGSRTAIAWGTELTASVTLTSGYRIGNMTINGVSLGAVRSHKFILTEDTTITAEFVAREVDYTEMVHTIDVVANNISDREYALAAEPYRFRIKKSTDPEYSEWSAPQTDNTIVFADLDPNTQYIVEVEATDYVGNPNWSETTISTLANVPIGLYAMPKNEDNSYTKLAAVGVDPNGNPENTEYRVYYSSSRNMANMQIANYTADDDPNNDGWETLTFNPDTGEYEFTVRGLTAGQTYYMQVVARNTQGVETASTGDPLEVLLSPRSPDPNTLYFSEQDGPAGGVTLHWVEVPDTGVDAIEIYRDGSLLKQVSIEESSYTDPRDNIPGDKVSIYSYAYKNETGAGSRRTAVSEEYFTAAKEDKSKLTIMDELAKADDATSLDLFTQTLSYPAYPENITATAQAGGDTYSGTITATVNYNGANVNRPQNYKLGLRAYYPDGGGEVPENDETGWKIQYQDTNILTSSGAVAIWENLYVNYEYAIFIEEIRTTGPQYITDDEGNSVMQAFFGNADGIEGYLGKRYVINREGYYSEFMNLDDVKEDFPGLAETQLEKVEKTAWAADLSDMKVVTNGAEWGENFTGRLKFNKSPYIALANENVYADSVNEVVDTAAGNYILIDQQSDPTFKLNVAAWDPDGTADENTRTATIEARVNNGTVTTATLSGILDEDLPRDETAAQLPENIFTLDFSVASSISTNFYENLTLRVNDGEINYYNEDEKIGLLINQTRPAINTTVIGSDAGASEHKIEAGKTYTESLLSIDTAVSGNLGNLRPVRLRVMADTYDDLFESHVFETIVANLEDPDSKATASAKDLLGDAYGTYANSTLLAEAAIDAVDPEYTAYVLITDSTVIDTHEASLVAETSGSTTRYWAEVGYAMEHNICTWFEQVQTVNENNEPVTGYKVTGAEGSKHPLRIVANFGRNTHSTIIYFACAKPAGIEIESEAYWEWVEVDYPEYEAYVTPSSEHDPDPNTSGITIKDRYDMTAKGYVNTGVECPEPTEDKTSTAPAYKTEVVNGTTLYYVYKLNDYKLELVDNKISGVATVTTGVYPQFEAGYVLITNSATQVVTEEDIENPGNLVELISITDEDDYTTLTGQEMPYPFVSSKQLEQNKPYYLYTAFTYKDPADENKIKTVINQEDAIVVTTNFDYEISKFGFNKLTASYKESLQSTSDKDTGSRYGISVSRTGDIDLTAAKVKITANFYEADQFGNLKLDETTGEPIPLEGDYLKAAREVFSFDPSVQGDLDAELNFTLEQGVDRNVQSHYFYLRQNGKEQKHMIIRMTLSIEENIKGFNRIKESAGVFDVFYLDAESKVTEYRVAVDNAPDENGKTLDEVKTELTGGKTHIDYEYQFEGLQVGYTSNETRTITLINGSDPEGELTGITVNIYNQKDKTSGYSDDFKLVWQPSSSLAAQNTFANDSTNFQVTPDFDLEDGVHEAWLNITAAHVETEDEIWIKLTQIVGQSTLSGSVYFTQTTPGEGVFTGVSTVSLYPYDAISEDDGTIIGEPLYQTQTSEYGGRYEIRNIIDGQRYYLVVERDGYITYDTLYAAKCNANATYYFAPKDSQHYELNLQLRGGDIDEDADIDMDDYKLLSKYFNSYYGSESATAGWDAEFKAGVKRADFNGDKIVNVFDRIIFWDSYALRYGTYNDGNNDYNYGATEEGILLRTAAYDYLGRDRLPDDSDEQAAAE